MKTKPCKLSVALAKAILWLNTNMDEIINEEDDIFDFPNYWGLPKDIVDELGPDDVDYIQAHTWDWVGEEE